MFKRKWRKMTGFSVGINILVCDFNTIGEETASLEKKILVIVEKTCAFHTFNFQLNFAVLASDIVFSMKNSASVGW